MDLVNLRKRVGRAVSDADYARRAVTAERDALTAARGAVDAAVAAQKLVQETAAGVQESAHGRVAAVVTRCLAAIFDDPYAFRVIFEQKRGKTEARLTFERRGHEVDPTTAAEGGAVDVAAFALRLAKLLLERPAVRRLLVLDEPFRCVDRRYGPRVRELLLSLARELEVQFVIITHDPRLVAGTVVEFPR